jgi:hypothetical protein
MRLLPRTLAAAALALAALIAPSDATARQVNPADKLTRYRPDRLRSDPARGCTHAIQPGAFYLLAWLLTTQPAGQSWGIEECRRVRGGRSFSLHAEGRAVDWRLDVDVPAEKRTGDRLVSLLLRRDRRRTRNALARRMGLQEVIWNCRIWTPAAARLRPYGPCSRRKVDRTTAHRDHLHLGLNWRGAKRKTTFWRYGWTVPS